MTSGKMLRIAATSIGAVWAMTGAAMAADTTATDEMARVYMRLDLGQSVSAGTSGDIFHGTGFGQNFGDAFLVDGGIGVGLGTHSGMGLRVDATIGWRPTRTGYHSALNTAGNTTLSTTTSVDTFTVLGNAYVDFPIDSFVTPYVGAGAGVATNKLNTLTYFFDSTQGATETGTTQSNFAWQVMAGLSAPLSPNMTAEVAYHYLDTGAVRSSGAVTLGNGVTSAQPPVQSNLQAHEFTVGLRIAF